MALLEINASQQLEQILISRLSRPDVKNLVQRHSQPYKELMACYSCAMMEVSAKFHVLNEDLSLQYDRNPIETIKTCLKTPETFWKS